MKLFIGIGISWLLPLQGQSFSIETVLDVFFKDLYENTTAGYVLYGEKPVDLQGFLELERTIPGTKERQRSVTGLLALNYLKNRPHQSGKYIITISPAPTGYEILSINREAFLKIIKKNNLLFSYRFGPDYSPESLLNLLIIHGFNSVFKGHTALQGIVLGYGIENAITYEKCSSFLKPLGKKIIPPLRAPPSFKNPEERLRQITDAKMLEQMREMVSYTPQNKKDKVKIPFSYLKKSKNSKKLISAYQKAQSQIEKELLHPHFLRNICTQFEISLAVENSLCLQDEEKAVLPSLVARTLRNTFPKQISKEFIAGMRAAISRDTLDTKDLKFLDILWQRDSSHSFLKSLLKKNGVECIIPNYLYFHIIKPSNTDEQLTLNHKEVKAHYLIRDLNGSALCGSYQLQAPSILCLSELIPGLAHGLIGARKGEIREIYIHPDFAYGSNSDFGNGEALIVVVELLDMGKTDHAQHIPPLQPADMHLCAPKITSSSQFISYLHQHAYACGFRSWNYYKQAEPLINLEAVLNCLCGEDQKPLTPQEKLTLLKLEWMIPKNCENGPLD